MMQFIHTDEQMALAGAIDEIVAGHGSTSIAHAWGSGDTAPGIKLWDQFTELGLSGLRVDEASGGMGGSASDLATVFERFGYHAVPGPYLESIALLPHILGGSDIEALVDGAVATAAVDPVHPYALDANVASLVFTIDDASIAPAKISEEVNSISRQRKLFAVTTDGAEVASVEEVQLHRALNDATLANTAMLLGSGERLLQEAVEYAKIREQFGRPIGEYQALKHQLADVRVALSFARPLLWQAALALESEAGTSDRDVSAAKVATASAAALASRVSLQVHGAVGYTAEHDLSLWLTWVPALTGIWGTPAFHRNRVALSVLSR